MFQGFQIAWRSPILLYWKEEKVRLKMRAVCYAVWLIQRLESQMLTVKSGRLERSVCPVKYPDKSKRYIDQGESRLDKWGELGPDASLTFAALLQVRLLQLPVEVPPS